MLRVLEKKKKNGCYAENNVPFNTYSNYTSKHMNRHFCKTNGTEWWSTDEHTTIHSHSHHSTCHSATRTLTHTHRAQARQMETYHAVDSIQNNFFFFRFGFVSFILAVSHISLAIPFSLNSIYILIKITLWLLRINVYRSQSDSNDGSSGCEKSKLLKWIIVW